jgi:hypothetical protein
VEKKELYEGNQKRFIYWVPELQKWYIVFFGFFGKN